MLTFPPHLQLLLRSLSGSRIAGSRRSVAIAKESDVGTRLVKQLNDPSIQSTTTQYDDPMPQSKMKARPPQ